MLMLGEEMPWMSLISTQLIRLSLVVVSQIFIPCNTEIKKTYFMSLYLTQSQIFAIEIKN